MKKLFIVLLLVLFICIGLFAQNNNRNFIDSKIKVNHFYENWSCNIITYTTPSEKFPEKDGPIIYLDKNKKEQRRFPDLKGNNRAESIGTNIKAIQTGHGQTVEMLVGHEPNVFKLSFTAKTRLLVIQPNSRVEFNLTGIVPLEVINPLAITIPPVGLVKPFINKDVDVTDMKGFVLRAGSIKEDNDFKTVRKLDDKMEFYSFVSETWIGNLIIKSVKVLKSIYIDNKAPVEMLMKYNLSPKVMEMWGELSDKEKLANVTIGEFALGSGLFSVLTSYAHPAMVVAEVIGLYDMAQNINKAGLAYALAYVYYDGKKLTQEELQVDLYVLFADNDVETTLESIAKWAGLSAGTIGDLLTREELMAAIGKKAFKNAAKAVAEAKDAEKVIGISKAAEPIPVIARGIGVVTNGLDILTFGDQAKKYYNRMSNTVYTVTFSRNDGKDEAKPDKKTVKKPAIKIDSLPKQPVRNGYTFEGWNIQADGKGAEFKLDTIIKTDMTVYAQWKVNTYTVTFDKNGGNTDANPTSKTAAYNTTLTFPKPPTREGHVFAGWSTKANGGGPPFSASYPVTGNMTVYAQWIKNAYNVTFDKNGGTTDADPPAMAVAYNAKAAMPKPPTKEGHAFTGWSTKANGGGPPFSESYPVTGNMTVYAQWKIKTYSVTFNKYGFWGYEPNSEHIKAVYNTVINPLPIPPPRKGSTFDGWYTKPKGGGTAFTAATPVTEDVTVYAKWKDNSAYTVTFNMNDGSGEDKQQTKDVKPPETTVDALPKQPTRKGYTFEGWNTKDNGKGTAFTKDTPVKKDITVYAVWKDDGSTPPADNVTTAGKDIFFPSKAGTTLTYANYDAKGIITGYSLLTIKNIKGSGKNMNITCQMTGLDSGRKPVKGAEVTYEVVIKDGVTIPDINQVIPAEMRNMGLKIDTKGIPVEYPSDLKVGQSLKPSELTMTMDVSGMKITSVLKITGKCLAIEDVKVPAGTFKCHKITETYTVTSMGINNNGADNVWLAPGIGQIKLENYDEKNKLVSSSVLLEIKGR